MQANKIIQFVFYCVLVFLVMGCGAVDTQTSLTIAGLGRNINSLDDEIGYLKQRVTSLERNEERNSEQDTEIKDEIKILRRQITQLTLELKAAEGRLYKAMEMNERGVPIIPPQEPTE